MIKTACPTTLNLPYSEREIKIEWFGGRPPFGGRPGALGPMPPPLNPALASLTVHTRQRVSVACRPQPISSVINVLVC